MGDTFLSKTLPALGALLIVAAVAAAGIFIVGISKPQEQETESTPNAQVETPPSSQFQREKGNYSDFFESNRYIAVRGKITARPVNSQLQVQVASGAIVTYFIDDVTQYYICKKPSSQLHASLAAGWDVSIAHSVEQGDVLKAAAVDIQADCPSSAVQSPPAFSTYTQFGKFESFASGQIRIRQTSGLDMGYAVDADTKYFICNGEAQASNLAAEDTVVVSYSLVGNNVRKAVSIYTNKDCGAETKPILLAREKYRSHVDSSNRIISGTITNVSSRLRFDLEEASSQTSSFAYGVDTLFYKCGVPQEFTLAAGETVSVSFVSGLKPTNGVTYIAAVDLRDNC